MIPWWPSEPWYPFLRQLRIDQKDVMSFLQDLTKKKNLQSNGETSTHFTHTGFFQQNPVLCVATILKEYIDRTASLREPDNDFLFVTYKRPHTRASKDILSRWVKQTLTSAGVNTTLFTSHSVRHAATSAALRKGVSVDSIGKTVGWTQHSTFARFYNRPLQANNEFANEILHIDVSV